MCNLFRFICLIFTGGLLFYHSSLITKNCTTKEDLKHQWKSFYGNVYSRKILTNVKNILYPLIIQSSKVFKHSLLSIRAIGCLSS